uniref:Gfo/Idh/MocA-like oxidoreductase N-terminal domain-containing protein n=1 Tax=Odontella aurita TaxID=265563 RepID=A0A7S4NIZ9_9STRA|mmetsp:Transcript_9530/g.28616  ORF Transcript_9530/g.28616 Transcript_9530/m.28616 type:complete len:361 (+) Transcript_9530:113-1195(+)
MTGEARKRLALFGVGRWGSHLLRNFLAMPTVALMSVVEISSNQRRNIQEQFDLPLELEISDDVDAVLARSDIDAVVVATPAATHYALIKAALENKKHVLVEKPLTLQVAEAEELCCIASSNQRLLMVDHTYLFHPAVQQGRSTLDKNPLGKLHYGYATRTNLGPVRPDVDALWDLSIHDIAIFNYWLGEIPAAVSAQGQTWLQANSTSANNKRFPHGLSDAVWLTLFYPSGFQATIHVCWGNPDKQRRLAIVGDRGTLIFDEMRSDAPLVLQHGYIKTKQNCQPFSPQGMYCEPIAINAAEPLNQVCAHFIHCVTRGCASSISSGQRGVELVKILSALSKSLNAGGVRVEVPAKKNMDTL